MPRHTVAATAPPLQCVATGKNAANAQPTCAMGRAPPLSIMPRQLLLYMAAILRHTSVPAVDAHEPRCPRAGVDSRAGRGRRRGDAANGCQGAKPAARLVRADVKRSKDQCAGVGRVAEDNLQVRSD